MIEPLRSQRSLTFYGAWFVHTEMLDMVTAALHPRTGLPPAPPSRDLLWPLPSPHQLVAGASSAIRRSNRAHVGGAAPRGFMSTTMIHPRDSRTGDHATARRT